jgi:Caspase domain
VLFGLGALPGHAEKGVALVIGNSAYRSVPAPPNTQNDASDIAESFGRLGFSLKKIKDATFDETRRAWPPPRQIAPPNAYRAALPSPLRQPATKW